MAKMHGAGRKQGTSCARLSLSLRASTIEADAPSQFVADGEWKHDPTGKTETDHEGNINNVIHPEDIQPSISSAAMSSTGPEAT